MSLIRGRTASGTLPAQLRRWAALWAIALSVLALGAFNPSQARALSYEDDAIADLVERLSPAVVNISTAKIVGDEALPDFPPGSPLERFNDLYGGGQPARRQSSLGSGFVIDPSGVIVTNNHVVEDADEIDVLFTDGSELRAELIGRDPATDLAVLRVTPPAGKTLPFVPFGDSDRARPGQMAIVIGNPFGLGTSVSMGIVSARNRDIQAGRYDDFIQTDAAINRGNSGGPLFNRDGEVVGVTTAILSPTGASVGVGFAIPAKLAESIVLQLLEHGEVKRGWLGVNIRALSDQERADAGLRDGEGVVIASIVRTGPAAEGGMLPGDIVTRFDGRVVESPNAFSRRVADAPIGQLASVDVVRDGEALNLRVRVGQLDEDTIEQQIGEGETEIAPPPPARGEAAMAEASFLGVTVETLSAAGRARYGVRADVEGVLVTAVESGSDAAGKLAPGDVIVEIAFEPVSDPASAQWAFERADSGSGEPILLLVNRKGDLRYRSVKP